MGDIHNKNVGFVYADTSILYNESEKLKNLIYFVKDEGIYLGNQPISTYIPNVSINDWNSKQDAISDLDEIRANAALGGTALQSYTETDPTVKQYIKDISTADIDNWNSKQNAIPNSSFEYWNAKQDKLSDASVSYWNAKQETISDLETIRTGAGLGATALLSYTETDPIFTAHIAHTITDASIADWNSKQPKIADASITYWNAKQEAISDLETIRSGAALGATSLQSHQPIKTINNTSIIGEGNVTISGLPDVSTADNDKILIVINGKWQMVTPVFVYAGEEVPNNILGNNGDIYLQS